jgi:hypothetical protein
MNRIILFCIFALSVTSTSLAQSNQTESLSFTTYYPAPYGVFRYLKLSPADSSPASPSPGMMYYDNSSDSIRYNNSINWVELSGGGGGGGGNGTYWNRTGTGTSGDPYRLHNINTGFVGIGTQTPEAPLTVQLTDNNVNNAYLVGLKKHYNGSAFPDIYLRFKAYPSNTGGYLNATSVMYVPEAPPGNLEFNAVNDTQHIRFNIGNFTDPYSEVMRLVNPGQSKPMVGIGTTNPMFPLQIDANAYGISALGVRGMSNGQKSGFFNVFPWSNSMDLAYGCYRSNGWVNDPFDYVEYGVPKQNHTYAKLVLDGNHVYWYAGNSISGNNQIPYSGPPAGGFNLAFGIMLWDEYGTWRSPAAPPSSRKLKENFVKIRFDDLLRSIDRLEVCRWNYKSRDKSDHIGPMAEDFYRIFKTGSREDELNLIDSAGVSLAGVKALSREIKTQEREIEELEGEIKGLRARLGKLSAKGGK